MNPITHILFDLGNVLVELNGMPFLQKLYPGLSDQEIHKKWLSLTCVDDFECGRTSLQEFLVEAPQELELNLLPEQFTDLFASWMVGPFGGAVELVQSLGREYRVGCLSNTNEIHVDKLREKSSLLLEFHEVFLSYEIGFMKPRAEAFSYVLERWDVEAKRVLFLDDNQDNIDAAFEIGMTAVKVFGFEAVSAVCGRLPNQTQDRTSRS